MTTRKKKHWFVDASLLTKVVSGLFAVMIAIGGWWCNRIQNSVDALTKAVTELQVRADYVNGPLKAAPILTKLTPP